jgi:hypothetical protein
MKNADGEFTMSSVVLQFPAVTEQKLREQASRAGQTLENYLERIVEQVLDIRLEDADIPQENDRYISKPNLTHREFDRLLKELASGPPLPILPPDFSRADIYDDHD